MDKEYMEDRLSAPTPTAGDKGHAVVRSGLGALPFVGQTAIEIFSGFITPPLEKRRDEWMDQIGEMLSRLSEQKKINVEELQDDDAFIDLLMTASQAVARNSNKEKREALSAAVQNAALGHAPEEALQHMFIRWVDEFTVWHLRLLRLFQNPKAWAEQNDHKFPSWAGGGLDSVLTDAYPELQEKRPFYDQVWRDLNQRGLVSTPDLHGAMTSRGMFAHRTSEMGDQFLSYIESDDQ